MTQTKAENALPGETKWQHISYPWAAQHFKGEQGSTKANQQVSVQLMAPFQEERQLAGDQDIKASTVPPTPAG